MIAVPSRKYVPPLLPVCTTASTSSRLPATAPIILYRLSRPKKKINFCAFRIIILRNEIYVPKRQIIIYRMCMSGLFSTTKKRYDDHGR